MIKLPKSLSRDELVEWLIANYPVKQIAEALVETSLTTNTVDQISVTEEQKKAIDKLFKVKGQRITADGVVVTERRGRKPKLMTED